MPKTKFDSNAFLLAEFEYISKTASEANDDRKRIMGLYNILLTAISAFVGFLFNSDTARMLLTNDQYRIEISITISFLCGLLTIVSSVSLVQLARRRADWHESIEALHKIKEFYIKKDPQITSAIKWRKKEIPPVNSPYSIDNLVAIEMALVGALTTSVSIFFVLHAVDSSLNFVGFIVVGVSFFIGFKMLWSWYKTFLF